MTVDERLEFLLQSTESLHATALEHSAQIEKHSAQMEKQSAQMEKQSAQMEKQSVQIERQLEMLAIDASNIRRLADIATAHDERVESLEQRLDRLERRKQ